MLEEGLTYTSELTVAYENTYTGMGLGNLNVLATPALVALAENAAMRCVSEKIDSDCTTVGCNIITNYMHLTREGAHISATAKLVQIDGRKLHFQITVEESGTIIISEIIHTRVIVNRQRFLSNI